MNRFVITIARGYGSGGRTIGKMLAKSLGVHYYDRELMRLASDDSGINEELFVKADETLKKSLLFKIARKEYHGELIPPDSDDFVSNDNLFNYQAKIIKDLAKKGSCVIVGRCADFVLKDMDNVIKVYVHAPFEDCVNTMMNLSGWSREEAAKKITSIDKHRAEYYRYYTGRSWTDAGNYDLCLNSSKLGFDRCVTMVEEFIQLNQKVRNGEK